VARLPEEEAVLRYNLLAAQQTRRFVMPTVAAFSTGSSHLTSEIRSSREACPQVRAPAGGGAQRLSARRRATGTKPIAARAPIRGMTR
jgi:hypothetical protein